MTSKVVAGHRALGSVDRGGGDGVSSPALASILDTGHRVASGLGGGEAVGGGPVRGRDAVGEGASSNRVAEAAVV